jgi:hypothetical protein
MFLNGVQEVAGSIPVTQTIIRNVKALVDTAFTGAYIMRL